MKKHTQIDLEFKRIDLFPAAILASNRWVNTGASYDTGKGPIPMRQNESRCCCLTGKALPL